MKILSFLIGVVLIGLIVYIGNYTTNHPLFITWFGVITAILAPLAFEFLFYPFRVKDKKLIKELAKVPQIEKLLQEANNNETKVKYLKKQELELDKLISYETKRRTLIAEKEIYVLQGEEALKKIEKINEILELLTNEKLEMPESLKPLLHEIEKIESTDIIYVINNNNFVIKKKYFELFPFYGHILFEIFKLFAKIANKITLKIQHSPNHI
jgi:hypothetical protein